VARVYEATAPSETTVRFTLQPLDPLATALPKDGPGEVVMDKGGGLYGPARFDHKVHAEMARMSGGCGSCHHHAADKNVKACSHCHTTPLLRQSRAMLGWKGAYHQQCLGCHRSCGTGSDCLFCHKERSSQAPVRRGPPSVVMPGTKVYQTSHDGGTTVSFDHENHKECAECSDCHKKESCSACHRTGPKKAAPKPKDHHERCSSCHGKDKDLEFDCDDCHTK
jgi:hypothetical protein